MSQDPGFTGATNGSGGVVLLVSFRLAALGNGGAVFVLSAVPAVGAPCAVGSAKTMGGEGSMLGATTTTGGTVGPSEGTTGGAIASAGAGRPGSPEAATANVGATTGSLERLGVLRCPSRVAFRGEGSVIGATGRVSGAAGVVAAGALCLLTEGSALITGKGAGVVVAAGAVTNSAGSAAFTSFTSEITSGAGSCASCHHSPVPTRSSRPAANGQ